MVRTALEIAVLRADEDTIYHFLDNEPDTVLQGEIHHRLLDIAILSITQPRLSTDIWIRIINFLLSKGASFTNVSTYPNIPELVFKCGSVYILRFLLDNGLQLQTVYKSWENHYLHQAITNPKFEVFKYLIQHHQLDINTTNYVMETPLHIAAKNLWSATIQSLLLLGASPNLSSDTGLPIILVMDSSSDPGNKSFKYLLRASDFQTVMSALFHAFLQGHPAYIYPLIETLVVIHRITIFHPAIIRFCVTRRVIAQEYCEFFFKCQEEAERLSSVAVLHGTTLRDLYIRLYKKDFSTLSDPHVNSFLGTVYLPQCPIYGTALTTMYNKYQQKLVRNRLSSLIVGRIFNINMVDGLQHISDLIAFYLGKQAAIQLVKASHADA